MIHVSTVNDVHSTRIRFRQAWLLDWLDLLVMLMLFQDLFPSEPSYGKGSHEMLRASRMEQRGTEKA